MSRAEDLPDPAVVVVNPDDDVTPEAFRAWLDQLQLGSPYTLGSPPLKHSLKRVPPARCDAGR